MFWARFESDESRYFGINLERNSLVNYVKWIILVS